MKRIYFMLLAMLAGSVGCKGSTGSDTTTQVLSNQGLIFQAELAADLRDAFLPVSNCAEFQTALNNLTGTESCLDTGNQSLTVQNSSCADAPEFIGSATLQISFGPCVNPGETIGGSLTYELTWDGTALDTLLSTNDYSYNGIPYLITDLSVMVPADGPPECNGTILTMGEICVIIPDCTFCPL